jgi:hypothetical protein
VNFWHELTVLVVWLALLALLAGCAGSTRRCEPSDYLDAFKDPRTCTPS